MSDQSTGILQSPLCRELRSKKYFFLDALPLAAGDILGPDNHCWCRRTMQVVGPDGDKARPEFCSPSRECYKSQFAQPPAYSVQEVVP